MKIVMLGTGNASATKLFNTCFLFSDKQRPEGERCFLVDSGGGNGLFSQLEKAGCSWHEIHHIFITHRHLDHITGAIWLMKNFLSEMKRGQYNEHVYIYGHDEVINILRKEAELLFTEKDRAYIDMLLHLVTVDDKQTLEIIGRKVTFFDIHSTKAKQYGFSMELGEGKRLAFFGDEPINENCMVYAKNADWLLCEAFCLYKDRDIFDPYEKHHSTVKDACLLAQEAGAKNLVLFHTEDSNPSKRKELYIKEGSLYFKGPLYVPDDLEEIELDLSFPHLFFDFA